MNQYVVKRLVRLSSGIIGLNRKQAASRKQCLKPTMDGAYIIVRPMQFKPGEVVFLRSIPSGCADAFELLEADTR